MNQVKDYYKILELPTTASLQEIKRSFRRLAQQFHPDKNEGSQLAAAQFREIQEAYATLSDPKKREAYHYQRWYVRSTGKPFARVPLTPAHILQECRLLQQYVASMNLFHLRFDAVSLHIRELLTDNAIGMLQEQKDPATNRDIIQSVLIAAQPLPKKFFLPIATLLLKLADDDVTARSTIQEALTHKKQRHIWDKYKWVLMLVITALICWLIYRL
ncbi:MULTISPECIES: J domain-containing protein [Niastella]|uniref:J domain-containing protein n=1 Tax=Niastella soli TaxID=2821487 RepID=A0ABS3YXV5_9BACT|nr:J domain-containing protein [Niastella soli]MBO9202754.1 J domain-containing protein [Niastella soli]